jgi:hypothetical protein
MVVGKKGVGVVAMDESGEKPPVEILAGNRSL